MSLTATIVDIRGKAYEPVIEEILFENKTISGSLVSFETDVKAETIFTEASNSVTMQAYTSGAPTSQGSLGVGDSYVTPVKCMYYNEFAMESLRTSRFKRDMKKGAWNTASSEFEKTVLENYGKLISLDAETKFWQGITSATKTAIAALTPGVANTSVGAAEQTWAAAQTAGLFDGVVARMIYAYSGPSNTGALGKRIKVAGTTITSANIGTEYGKLYAAIPSVMAHQKQPLIYAPYSHKQLINIFNLAQTYRDTFSRDGEKYYYLGTEIQFVPLPENCMIVSVPEHLIWACDLVSDLNYMEVNKIANNRDDQFIKNVFTLAAHVVNQKFNVLYLG